MSARRVRLPRRIDAELYSGQLRRPYLRFFRLVTHPYSAGTPPPRPFMQQRRTKPDNGMHPTRAGKSLVVSLDAARGCVRAGEAVR